MTTMRFYGTLALLLPALAASTNTTSFGRRALLFGTIAEGAEPPALSTVVFNVNLDAELFMPAKIEGAEVHSLNLWHGERHPEIHSASALSDTSTLVQPCPVQKYEKFAREPLRELLFLLRGRA